ncbi:hypothetical protein ACFL35_01695 [Candidatus Riflebacteria bacterium]
MIQAARGLRETEQGTVPINDEVLDKKLRAKSRTILIKTLALTIALVALGLVPIPGKKELFTNFK